MQHDQRKQRKRAVGFPFVQKIKNLQHPECTAPHRTDKRPGCWAKWQNHSYFFAFSLCLITQNVFNCTVHTFPQIEFSLWRSQKICGGFSSLFPQICQHKCCESVYFRCNNVSGEISPSKLPPCPWICVSHISHSITLMCFPSVGLPGILDHLPDREAGESGRTRRRLRAEVLNWSRSVGGLEPNWNVFPTSKWRSPVLNLRWSAVQTTPSGTRRWFVWTEEEKEGRASGGRYTLGAKQQKSIRLLNDSGLI